MLRRRSQGLDRADWLALILCLLGGCGLSYALLEGALQSFLEPKLIEETALRTSRSVRLVEIALEKHFHQRASPRGDRAAFPAGAGGADSVHEQLRS